MSIYVKGSLCQCYWLFNLCHGLHYTRFGTSCKSDLQVYVQVGQASLGIEKWIFKYLKGTTGHGIMLRREHDYPLNVGYVHS